jgi:hypothetical protein
MFDCLSAMRGFIDRAVSPRPTQTTSTTPATKPATTPGTRLDTARAIRPDTTRAARPVTRASRPWAVAPLVALLALGCASAAAASPARASTAAASPPAAASPVRVGVVVGSGPRAGALAPVASVTLRVGVSTAHSGKTVHLRGSVPRNHVRATVTIQTSTGQSGPWRAWKTVRIGSRATYIAAWQAPFVTGTYWFRTRYPADRRYRTSYSPTRSIAVDPGILARRDLIYGSEIETAQIDGRPAVDPSTGIPAKVIAAGIPVVRFMVYDVFTDMKDPNGNPGTIRRADFDHAIRGIVNTLHAIPWISLLPVIGHEKIDTKYGTVFVPPLKNLGRDLRIHKAILKEIRKVYGGPIIIESDNEGEYDSWRTWGFSGDGGVGVSAALGRKYVATMPALKKYARDVLHFSQVVTAGYVGVPGGPGWDQKITRDPSKPYGYACEYYSRSIDEFNTAVHKAYLAHGRDPDYIPDVESVHAYPHSPDFSDKKGYEFDDNMAYAYYHNWLVQSRRHLERIWGATVGSRVRFSVSEWSAGADNSDGVWSGWSTPSRVQQFFAGWLKMLQGNGVTTGSGTRFWHASCFELASESPTGDGHYYNLIREDGSTPAWYDTFKQISTSDPLR